MKKLLLIFTAVLLCFTVGCGTTKTNEPTEISIVFVATSSTLEIDENTTLEDYIVALRDKGDIMFEGENGDFGLFITSMDGKANEVISSTPNSSEGYSWTIYIDFLTLDGVIYAGDSETVTFNDITLYKAIYGISAIPCLENHTYAFVYEYYKFSW